MNQITEFTKKKFLKYNNEKYRTYIFWKEQFELDPLNKYESNFRHIIIYADLDYNDKILMLEFVDDLVNSGLLTYEFASKYYYHIPRNKDDEDYPEIYNKISSEYYNRYKDNRYEYLDYTIRKKYGQDWYWSLGRICEDPDNSTNNSDCIDYKNAKTLTERNKKRKINYKEIIENFSEENLQKKLDEMKCIWEDKRSDLEKRMDLLYNFTPKDKEIIFSKFNKLKDSGIITEEQLDRYFLYNDYNCDGCYKIPYILYNEFIEDGFIQLVKLGIAFGYDIPLCLLTEGGNEQWFL